MKNGSLRFALHSLVSILSIKLFFYMKKIYLFSFLFLLFLTPLSIKAQQPRICGLSAQDARILQNSMLELRERHPTVAPLRAVAYVPVWFHLVAKTDGTGRIGMNKVLEMLCEWNRLYSTNSIDLQFYIKGINNINNSSLYDGPRSFGGDVQVRTNKKSDGMNVYLVNNANDPQQPNATVLGYYLNTGTGVAYEADWLIIINSQVSQAGAVTIAHEAGHHFSLPHTFLGWESCPFQPTIAVPCAPATIGCFGGGVYTVENAARTGTDANCANAGDSFCDTPPDYNLGFGAGTCTYAGLACDPKGVKIDPDEKNIMSYFSGCETAFSVQQKTAMLNNYMNHASRAGLRAGNVAPGVTTLTTVAPTSPIGGITTPYYNNFTLNWDAVAGATGYLVEISKSPTFFDSRILEASTNALNLNNNVIPGYFSAASQTYHWRVKPYSNYVSCTNFTSRQYFTAGLVNGTNEIAGVSSFDVSPNPLSKTQSLNLNITSEKAFEAKVKLYNIAGKLIHTEKRAFGAGFSTQTMSVSDLTAGLYILSLESEKGVLNKKIVVQN
jgi:Secretion system C-terminal sorting domain